MTLSRSLWLKIKSTARRHEVDPHIVGAVVLAESAGQAMAMRYEPNWRYLYKPELYAKLNVITLETERVLQSCSWGLMQIMGTVAREWGHKGPMPEILQPGLNLELGCKHLKKKISLHGMPDGIAAYNAGSPRKRADGKFENQKYVDTILKMSGALSLKNTKLIV